jgi:peptide/nickel transport system substrate-binding protein
VSQRVSQDGPRRGTASNLGRVVAHRPLTGQGAVTALQTLWGLAIFPSVTMARSARGWPALVGLGAILLAACGSDLTPTVTKTTATFAEAPGAQPDYIFPLVRYPDFNTGTLSQFQYLMYRPLYLFGTDGQVRLNTSLSLADPPVFSSGGRSVTVTLKGWKWSDGTQITARDIQFWQNLVSANKYEWAGYTTGEYPDNVLSTTINPTNPLQITFDLSQAYSSYFFTYNELSQITPLPQHVWDKESPTGAVGNYDETPAGAQAVYKYLDYESKSISTYDANPLWQVVSGPWKLKSMDTTGDISMVPNTAYGGPIKPTLMQFNEVPFTDDTSEFDELKAASSVTNTTIDYGYIPYGDVGQRASLSRIYNFQPWTGWQITYMPENFSNPTSGPIFSQLYFRQAMQDLVDQKTVISKAFSGFAYPTYGPVPIRPTSRFVDAFEKTNPYPYSPSTAVSLLQANGWRVNAGGISTCTSPGTGSGECGAGVPMGARASFNLQYASGMPALDQEMAQFKTDFALAGIQIELSSAPFNTVVAGAVPCGGTSCGWDMAFWGAGWFYAPDYDPTGDELWSCTGPADNEMLGGADSGGYCDRQAESDILATEFTNSALAMQTYQDYMAKQLPVIWLPVGYGQLSMVNKDLRGTFPQDPLLQIYPENWRWS